MACPHCGSEKKPEEKEGHGPENVEGPDDPSGSYTYKRRECPDCKMWIGDELVSAA